MKMERNVAELLQQIGAAEGEGFTYDEEGIRSEIALNESAYSNIIIKVLSAIGGFLATLAFLGFLLLAGIYQSEGGMFVTGIFFIIAAIGGSRVAGRSFLDTAALTLYITGFILMGAGLLQMEKDPNVLLLLSLLLSLAGVLGSGGFMMIMVSVLLFNASLFSFFPVNHIYGNAGISPMLLIIAVLLLLTANEPRIITGSRLGNKLYKPVQSGFFISFLAGLLWMLHEYMFGFGLGWGGYPWALGIFTDIGIGILVWKIIGSLGITHKGYIAGIYLFTLAVLLPVFYFPYIPGALFLLLLSIYYGYKVEAGLSVAALAYFIIKYYYDLQMSLLYKSGLLFFPGILLLLVWYFYNRQLKKDEKI